MLRFVREIDPGKIRRDVVVDVIGNVEIPLSVSLCIRRVGQCALALANAGQEVVTPVVGHTNLQAFTVVKADEVRGITEPVQNELSFERVEGIIGNVGINERRVLLGSPATMDA